ncbi:Nuclear protein involved in cell morphogenesis and cell surface growth [Handroanthus impetiginosus]|uniref:Nuclear protein involved in cell morphogenesis and cell surface growth n=1 Tax=Handroanthus impetiginosus TaxID=429701 RepID=A0A2G9I942_9LAMI|nr:Nuclear protein involved in cell morphogenesis and cell surface growth [Handroanthus impetiginosus]
MDLIVGFKERLQDSDEGLEDKCSSSKLVPWISWDEWKFVKESLFSSSPNSVISALQRISTWRSRGCIPMAIEVTASIIEIQQKDSFFGNDLNESTAQSEEMLAMLYCMAIMRLVNGVVERTRKKNEVSIGEAADAIGIPRMLIDIRHEGSHRDLPSLQLVRLASKKALDWLVSYYWEPQEKEIPVQSNQTANLRKEIKRKLREVALCLKAKQMAKSSSSHTKGKRVRQAETLHGRSKFMFLVSGKPSHSSSTGFKKQLAKSMKHALRLYSSFSPEVINILLEYLLNALDLSNSVEHVEGNERTAFDDWKSVVLKLSRKEPEFLLSLTQAVLGKMEETHGTMNHELDDHQSPENLSKSHRMELLSCLFEWLTGNLKMLYPANQKESAENKVSRTDRNLAKATVLGLLRRCLLVSSPGDKHLMNSAVTLAQLNGDSSLLHKLKKLSLLELSDSEANSVNFCNETDLSQQEHSIRQAEEKFKLIKCSRLQNKNGKLKHSHMEAKSRWAVAKSWNPCPIGMIPHTIGFSGRLPVLDYVSERREEVMDNMEHRKVSLGKREAENGIEKMDNTFVKRVKETEADCLMYDHADVSAEGVQGHLMIDGVWKKVAEEELVAIASAVRLLV